MTQTTTTEAPEIYKVDVIGRVKVPLERRDALVDEFERSGMSGSAFARRYGIQKQTFATWVQKRRRADGTYDKMRIKREAVKADNGEKKTASKVKWLEVVKEPPVVSAVGLKVELPGGGVVRVEDASQAAVAAVLIRELQKSVPIC